MAGGEAGQPGETYVERSDGSVYNLGAQGQCEVEPGDVVVQNGTRHSWHYVEKCTIAWILIGVERRK